MRSPFAFRNIDLTRFTRLRASCEECVRSRVPQPWRRTYLHSAGSPCSLAMHNYSLPTLDISSIIYLPVLDTYMCACALRECMRLCTSLLLYLWRRCLYPSSSVCYCCCVTTSNTTTTFLSCYPFVEGTHATGFQSDLSSRITSHAIWFIYIRCYRYHDALIGDYWQLLSGIISDISELLPLRLSLPSSTIVCNGFLNFKAAGSNRSLVVPFDVAFWTNLFYHIRWCYTRCARFFG